MADAVKEYLYMLKPVVDKNLWSKATGTIEELLTSRKEKLKEKLADKKAKDEITGNDVKLPEDQQIKKVEGALKLINGVKAVASKVMALVTIFTETIDKAQELLDKASDVSNKFVTGESAFIDTEVRDYMMNFGVDNKTAQSIIAAEDALGVDASDYALLTEGQRKAFDRLMQHYQEGLESLDTAKLDEYNKMMQEYQMTMAEFEMDVKLAIIELMSNSEPLKDLMAQVQGFFKDITTLLSSDVAQFAFDSFVAFLRTIIELVSLPVKLLGGGGSNTTNNTVNNYNNTTNTYNSTNTGGTNPLYIQQATSTPIQ